MASAGGCDSARSDSSRPRSGSRAHELLASLDAAKRQKVQNEKLRHLVLDAEELGRKLVSQLGSARQRAELERQQQRSSELLRELNEGVSYVHLCKFNVSRYMTDCAQEMQVRDLCRPEDKPDTEPVNGVVAVLSDMRGRGTHAAHFTEFIDQGLRTLGKAQVLLQGSKLLGKEWADLVQPLLLLLREVMNQPHVRDCLAQVNEAISRLHFSVQEVAEEQAEAIERGDMQHSEQLYYKKITMQEALADMVTKKFDAIDAEEDSAFRLPLQRVHEVHGAANRAVSELLHRNETLKQRCEKDLANLNARVEAVNLADYNDTKAHAAALDKVSWALKENQLQQESCWQRMQQLERDLAALADQRMARIQDHIRLVEDSEKRKVEYQNFMEFVAQHKALLELSIHNCELAEEITDCIDEVVSSGCNAVERRMRDVEKEIEDLRIEVHQEYLENFRGMYLTLGDLQYKKEANIAAIDEKIQHAHMQQEMMMESLNPKAREFSQLKKDLARTKEELESQVTVLREKSTLYIEAFKPTEQALIHAGQDFDHPVDQLVALNQQRRHKLLAYQELLEQEASGEAGLDAEREQIDMLRLTYQTHRSGGSPHAGADPSLAD